MSIPCFQKLNRVPTLCCCFLCIMVLSGCMGGGNSDLEVYFQDIKNKPKGSIEPLPPLRTYEAFIYNVTAKRSPFDRPVEIKKIVGGDGPVVKPDIHRELEYLEEFDLGSLTMMGSLERNGVFWVLILDGLGAIHRVTVGQYMGKDRGKVVRSSPTEIDLEEIVSNGSGGWLKRPRTLKLVEKD